MTGSSLRTHSHELTKTDIRSLIFFGRAPNNLDIHVQPKRSFFLKNDPTNTMQKSVEVKVMS